MSTGQMVKKDMVMCYNCGSPDHYVVACPEATRARPFGLNVAESKAAAQAQAQLQGRGYVAQHSQNAWHGPYRGPQGQGQVVTKFATHNPPVVTKYAPPIAHQPQQVYGAYPQPNPPHIPQSTPQPPYYPPQQAPAVPSYGPPQQQPPYGQYNPQQGPPAPPPQGPYVQYGQPGHPYHPTPPPPPQNYGQYIQPQPPVPQPYYGAQPPPPQPHYPPQHAPLQPYQNGQQNGYPVPQQPQVANANGQQYGYPGPQQPQQANANGQQYGYHGPQQPQQANAWNQQPNGYQQPNGHQQPNVHHQPNGHQQPNVHHQPNGYQPPNVHHQPNGFQQPNVQHQPNGFQQPHQAAHQHAPHPVQHQPPQWNQPPPGQQHNGNGLNGPAHSNQHQPQGPHPPAGNYGPNPAPPPPQGPYPLAGNYGPSPAPPPPQGPYPPAGNYGPNPAPPQHGTPQMAPLVQQNQQYSQSQYESGNTRYRQGPEHPAENEQYYDENDENYENEDPNSTLFPFSDQGLPSAPPTSTATVQDPSQGPPQETIKIVLPVLPKYSDEEEIEWMLEKHLKRRMVNSGKSKPIADLTTDDYYALLAYDENRPCDPIGKPLPDTWNEDIILPPKYGATGMGSSFITPGNVAEFTKSIRDQLPFTSFAREIVLLGLNVDSRGDEKIDVDPEDVPIGPKSLKRSASAQEEDPSEYISTETTHKNPLGPGNHNKRAKFSSASFTPIQTVASSSMLDSIPEANRSVTPSIERETTPAFDLGEGGSEGGDDPWAVEPGEGSVEEKPVDERPFNLPKANGGRYGRPFPAQDLYSQIAPRSFDHGFDGAGHHGPIPPKRKDSGYVSARSSRTSSSCNGHNHSASLAESQHAGRNPFQQAANQFNGGQYPQPYNQGSPLSSDSDQPRPGESPLTPRSAELLGHLVPPLPDNGKAGHPKVKPHIRRRQPEVEEAYSRRW